MSYMSGCAYHLQVCAHVYLFSDIPYIQHQSANKEDLKTTFKFPKLLDKRSEGVLPQTKEGDGTKGMQQAEREQKLVHQCKGGQTALNIFSIKSKSQ